VRRKHLDVVARYTDPETSKNAARSPAEVAQPVFCRNTCAMRQHLATIEVPTKRARELVDITAAVRAEVSGAGIRDGICALYAEGATAALMVQENDDPNIAFDVLDCLAQIVPAGKWRHDDVDNNGAAHIQAGLVGPSEVVPVRAGQLSLSTWQNIFLCDFDGPRSRRTVRVTIQGE
jgi:secondary thiamine-phosphate synthase enzyme